MTKFIYGLDNNATEIHKALIADGLTTRFPDVEFERQSDPGPFLEGKIIPLVGKPHPTDPDCSIIEMVPDALRERVREAFDELLLSTASVQAS